MDETFEVGEIAVLQNLEWIFKFLNGEEVEVVGGLAQRNVMDLMRQESFDVTYVIDYRGVPLAVRPSNLKKKPKNAKICALLRELEAA